MSVRFPGRQSKDLTQFQAAIEQLTQGRSNATGTFTLASGATSTTVAAPTVAPGTVILLSAMTANAAAALATTYVTAANVFQGSFTVTHANNAQSDRMFGFVGLG